MADDAVDVHDTPRWQRCVEAAWLGTNRYQYQSGSGSGFHFSGQCPWIPSNRCRLCGIFLILVDYLIGYNVFTVVTMIHVALRRSDWESCGPSP